MFGGMEVNEGAPLDDAEKALASIELAPPGVTAWATYVCERGQLPP
jgi:hypothetical protein